MLIEQTTAPAASIIQKGNIMPAMDETLVSLDCIHGAVSVVGSMNADYTVTTERLPKPGETVLGIRLFRPLVLEPKSDCLVCSVPTLMRIFCLKH